MRILTVALMLASTSAFSFELSGNLVTAENDFLRENAGSAQRIAEGVYRISGKDGEEIHAFGKAGLQYNLRKLTQKLASEDKTTEEDVSRAAILANAIAEMTNSKAFTQCNGWEYEIKGTFYPVNYGTRKGGTVQADATIRTNGFGPPPPGEGSAYTYATVYTNGVELATSDSDAGQTASAASTQSCGYFPANCNYWEAIAEVYAPGCGYHSINPPGTRKIISRIPPILMQSFIFCTTRTDHDALQRVNATRPVHRCTGLVVWGVLPPRQFKPRIAWRGRRKSPIRGAPTGRCAPGAAVRVRSWR